jgi:peroxiredoxin
MKIILILLAIILCCEPSFSQNSDSSSLPYALLTEKQIKVKNIVSKVGNYDAAIGQPFSSFSITSIDGKKISSQHLIGKVTFINFWFDACAPCHLEFGNLNSLYTRYKSDSNFQIISFTFDGIEAARVNANKYSLLYRIVSVSNELCHQLNFQHGFPANFIVDEFGKVYFGHTGVGKDGTDVFAETIIPKIDSLLVKLEKSKQKSL